MRYLSKFSKFIEKQNVEPIGPADGNVEIRIDVEAIPHALDMQYRHGIDKIITQEEIIDTIKRSIEELTISLMQDKFSIYQEEDDYPILGIKAGSPNRFLIKNISTNLNIVCELKPGENNFTLTVVTVMRSYNFKTNKGQFVIKV